MYYDMDYYGVLMSKIGGGYGWNNYGYGSTSKTGGRQTLTRGQAVQQASYADSFMKMSKAERRSTIESNINTGSTSGNGNTKKNGTVGRSNLYKTMYGAQQTNSNLNSLLGSYYGLAGGYGSSFGLSSYLNNWFA